MQINIPFTLDVTRHTHVHQYMTARQGDSNVYRLGLTITNGGRKLAVPDNAAAELKCIRPDGALVTSDGSVMADGTIKVTVPTRALTAVGIVFCEVNISDDTSAFTTETFDIRVEPTVIGEKEIDEPEYDGGLILF